MKGWGKPIPFFFSYGVTMLSYFDELVILLIVLLAIGYLTMFILYVFDEWIFPSIRLTVNKLFKRKEGIKKDE